MATKAVDEYRNEITKLKDKVTTLESSKIEMMLNFTKEIDRLRGYIKRMSGIKHERVRHYNGFLMNHTNDGMELKISPTSSIVSPVTDATSKDITSPEMDVRENLPLSPAPIKESQSKPIPQRTRFNTDTGHEPHGNDIAHAMETHHEIIIDMQQKLDEFKGLKLFGVVECKCEEPKPLQFIFTMDEPEMKCDNCHHSYSSIFKCDSCTMSICSKCQKYIAEMQCLKSVMQNFKYPRDFQRELENANSPRHLDHEYNDSIYSGFQYNYADPSHSVLDDKLIKLESKLRINAGYRLEDIFQEGLLYIDADRDATSEICYALVDYLDEIDWCCMLQTKWCLQLLEIYWQMYQYHICYQHEWGKWKKLRLLFSTPWNDLDAITIRERILKHNNVTKEYINDYYIPTINENQLIKPKLLYDADDNPINAEDKPKNVLFYSVDEDKNRNFGNKVIRLLRIIIDNEEYNGATITFERLKHKQYGKHNDVLADGIFYIWHCYGLRRSFALEEQLFTSFAEAIKEEETEPEYTEEPYMNMNSDRYRAPSYQAPVIDEYEADPINRNDAYDPLTPMCDPAPKFTYDTENAKVRYKSFHLSDDASSSHSLHNSDYGMMQFDPNENDF